VRVRRKVGIVAGACAALALVGSAGAVAWSRTSDSGRTVGTWHEAAGVERTPVSQESPSLTSESPAVPGAVSSPSGSSSAAASSGAASGGAGVTESGRLSESAQAPTEGRGQRVGELLAIEQLLGYGKPERAVFRYPKASYVKLHFNRMAMLPGDYVTVSNASGTESYRYDAPRLLDVAKPADRWAMSITGDTAVLEVHRGGGGLVSSLLGKLGVRVDKVAKGFTRSEQRRMPDPQPRSPERTGREESVCGSDESSDAVCYESADPVAYTRSKAIARLLINGTELCTGWRVGPNNRMLTNNHCFDNSDDAYETEVWFNYACAKCGGFETLKPVKVWGDKVLATDHTYDFTLFTVGDFAKVEPFKYLTLDTGRPAKGQELYVPQHPAGEPMRIAGRLGEKAGTCAVDNNSYNGYAQNSDVSYYCDTAGGSSGSPVLSRKTDKVVALHHFGGCPNSGVRADLLYNKIKERL
jgi:lysyl endopeptidase